ncbi:MAG: DUF1822 family protein [Xenococcaceae cyanobacterium MO_188.B19]|nr:DUF1822 family protein [Xenococcaceae cyanobacterium MO_188.B19]
MNLILQSHTLSVSLTLSARIKAEEFSRNQSTPQKAQQVYKNTLAVSAVNTYLNYLGWTTSLNTSNSWNPVMQSLLAVADLDIPQYGKVECCFMNFQTDFFVIPPEAREDRIAYIAVKLEPSLKSAKLLGFISEFREGEILLSRLRPILELPNYLEYWKQKQERGKLINHPVTKLKQWLKGLVNEGWYNLDEVFTPSFSSGFRSLQKLHKESLDEGISRVKLLNLKEEGRSLQTSSSYNGITMTSNQENQAIALILYLQERAEDLDISVKVCPINTNHYLPKGLEIFILDQQQQTVMHAQANKTKNIEFRFSGESGEYFSIKACLNQKALIETFTI